MSVPIIGGRVPKFGEEKRKEMEERSGFPHEFKRALWQSAVND